MPVPAGRVLEALEDPFTLPRWTGHRLVRRVEGQLVEVRLHGDVPLAVQRTDSGVTFTWSLSGHSLSIPFRVVDAGGDARVSVALPPLPPERLARTRSIVAAELRCLRALLAGEPAAAEDLATVDAFHLDVHTRKGL